MDTVRYWIALLLIVSLPPGILLWFLIHPLAAFWRREGPVRTYLAVSVPGVLLAAGIFLLREPLLAVEYGTSYPLLALGLLCLAGASLIMRARRRHLTFAILAGIPEISAERYPGRLLQEGIYARIRHPRYLEAGLGVLGYALLANHLALYLLFLLAVPALWMIVILEERELRQRFGAAYEEYSRQVPRFIPHFRDAS